MYKAVYLLMLPLIFLFSCQKEEEPENGNPGENPTEETGNEPITEATIGIEGGVLRNDQITVTIPAGAFQQDEQLNLTKLADTSCFGNNVVTETYMIEGLPQSFEEDIKIKMLLTGTLSNETYAVIGQEAMFPEDGASTLYYDFLPVEDSGEYVIFYLEHSDDVPSTESTKKSSVQSDSEKKWISVNVVSDYFSNALPFEDIRFKIYIPANHEDYYSPMIGEYLDNAYEIINNTILSTVSVKYIITFPVFIANLSGDYHCKFAFRYRSMDGKVEPKGILAVNMNKLDEGEMMSLMIGRELFRSLLFFFDPRFTELRTPEQIPHSWLDQALVSWSETELVDEYHRADHIPTDFKGNELAPFHGMHAGIQYGDGTQIQKILNHGRGMSAFAQYMNDQFFGFAVPAIIGQISEGNHPVDAIRNAFGLLHSDIPGYDFALDWTNFLAEYIQGQIFNVPGVTFIQSIGSDDIFTIDDETDTVKIFTGSFPDLSSRLYLIQLNDIDFRKTGTITVSLTENTSVDESNIQGLYFGVNQNQITLIPEEELDDLDYTNYESILMLISNLRAVSPYTESSTIGIRVCASREKVWPFNYCQVEMNILGDYLSETNPQVTEPSYYSSPAFGTWYFQGSCKENSFTGTLDLSYFTDTYHGDIQVSFDEELNITHYHMCIYDRALNANTLRWEITGNEAEKTYLSVGGRAFRCDLTGPEVCGSLQGVSNYSESTRAAGGIYEYTLLNHSCNEESFLKFFLNTR